MKTQSNNQVPIKKLEKTLSITGSLTVIFTVIYKVYKLLISMILNNQNIYDHI